MFKRPHLHTILALHCCIAIFAAELLLDPSQSSSVEEPFDNSGTVAQHEQQPQPAEQQLELDTTITTTFVGIGNSNVATPPASTYLMILKGMDQKGDHESVGLTIVVTILNIITKACCILTLVCLIICIWTFSAYKSLYSLRNTIHRNLCISLLFAEFFFLLGLHGLDVKTSRVECRVIAILLHYLFLSAYLWMFLEACLIYRQIICVFETNRNRLIVFYAVGYILPAIIVAISASIWWPDYGTDLYCWINFKSTTAVWALVGPVTAIFGVNFLVLMLAMAVLHQNAKKTTAKASNASVPSEPTSAADGNNNAMVILFTKQRQQQRRQQQQRHFGLMIKGSASLSCLLGLGWAFGFVTIVYTQGNIVAIIFTTLNCIQGIFIFVMHILLNRKVRLTVWHSVHSRFPCLKTPAPLMALLFCMILSFIVYHLVVKFVL